MDTNKIIPHEKILVVDDVPANLSVLTAALEPAGYEILAVPNGATALRVAAKAQPSLILLDIMMPEIDGLETCRRLKQDETTRDIPVIFGPLLTSRSKVELKDRAISNLAALASAGVRCRLIGVMHRPDRIAAQ